MFSWICPRCGRENRASDTECVQCKLVEVEEPQAAVPMQQPMAEPPPVIRSAPRPAPEPPRAEPVNPLQAPLQHAPLRRAAAPPPPPPAYRPAPKPGIPTWLLVPLFAFAFIGLGAALYFGYQRIGGGGKGGFTGGEVSASAPKAKGTNPLQKYVEVVGIRLTQDAKRKPQAKFVAVNHGSSSLDDLTANVTLWASTSRSEEDSVGTFTFKINSLAPNEAKEITTPLKTKLKVYELPDWQNLTAEVQITSP